MPAKEVARIAWIVKNMSKYIMMLNDPLHPTTLEASQEG